MRKLMEYRTLLEAESGCGRRAAWRWSCLHTMNFAFKTMNSASKMMDLGLAAALQSPRAYLLRRMCMHDANLDPLLRGKWELDYVWIFPGEGTLGRPSEG